MNNKKVMIATPSMYGDLCVEYVYSLVETIKLSYSNGVNVYPVFVSHDALIQRVRNDLISIAINCKVDDIIFIDSDMEWDPNWIFELLRYKEDVVGGTARKKTDDSELYAVKIKDISTHENGLIKCEGIGTGFLKLSKKALDALWEMSPVYKDKDEEKRMIFDIKIINGELYSEDIIICDKLNKAGFDCWLDPKMTCAHIGAKKFCGNIKNFIENIKNSKN
jgi:glycosyltransferase involved in cell wall biosynthesis